MTDEPATLEEAVERIRALEAQLEAARASVALLRATMREVVIDLQMIEESP